MYHKPHVNTMYTNPELNMYVSF